MIETLEDFHVRIWEGNNKCYALSKQSNWHKIFPSDSLQKVFWKNSDQTLYKSNFSEIKNSFFEDDLPMVRYSKSDKIGYLNITRFELKFGANLKSSDSKQLSELMDKIVDDFKGVNVIIIDLRSCMGGWPEYGEIVASRLTKEKRHYATTVKFKTAKDSLAPVKHYIKPDGPQQLNVPVIILTNKVVRSAAEDFILMLKQLPNVYIIGEPTWGAFAESDMHKLSNGWKVQYSNQKVYSPNGETYEGKGIPVDLRIDNTWENIVNKNDAVIEAAILYSKK